jgi:hypothetical protein
MAGDHRTESNHRFNVQHLGHKSSLV